MKTYSQKASEIERKWYIVDASKNTLGRISTITANQLIGKHKPTYTPHIDAGDYVIVINASKIQVSGNKRTDKKYYRHSGYPGNTKEATLAEKMEKDPTFAVENAVRGMLPKNKLQSLRLKRLHIYSGDDHKHTAQQPIELEVK